MLSNSTSNESVAIGVGSLQSSNSGANVAIGHRALNSTTTGGGNTAVGFDSLRYNVLGANNTAIGAGSQSGDFNGSVILGVSATATANNQFVVGSATTNAGTVTTEANASTKVWNVKINGVDYKILLA
jgi:hypothetical protein